MSKKLKVMGQCHFCQLNKELCNAHIIPRAFPREFNKYYNNKGPNLLVDEIGRRENVPNLGYADQNILCQQCDQKMGVWEKKLIEFFRGNISYEYTSVKLGVLSILWKAHITKHEFFKGISIGPFVDELHKLLIAEQLGREEQFPIWIHKYKNIYGSFGFLEQMIAEPFRFRDGKYAINFYRFDFGGHRILVKVDKRPIPQECQNYINSTSSNIKHIKYKDNDHANMQEAFGEFTIG